MYTFFDGESLSESWNVSKRLLLELASKNSLNCQRLFCGEEIEVYLQLVLQFNSDELYI